MFVSQIFKEGIYSDIKRLNLNKSPGSDTFSSAWYKKDLKPILLKKKKKKKKSSTRALTQGELLHHGKEATKVVIRKRSKDCANYRPTPALLVDEAFQTQQNR